MNEYFFALVESTVLHRVGVEGQVLDASVGLILPARVNDLQA